MRISPEIHRAGPPRNHDPSDNMSNATQQSRKPGDGRRRRSRGGRNHNKQQQDGRSSGEKGGRHGRSEEFRPQGPRSPRGRKQPVKLSWWQKLLKAVGLYKEPARPVQKTERAVEKSPPKSNVRHARSGEGEGKPAAQPAARRTKRGGDPSTVESARLYLGNLSYDVTEQDLQELFKGVGGVRNVEIVYNRSTHRSKGYGFVEMLHKDEAMRAVEVLHDQPFMGRKLMVSGAKSKGQDEREDRDEVDSSERIISLAPLPSESAEQAPEPQQERVEPLAQVDPAEPENAESADSEPGRRSEVA
jgi:hypothetical protein